MPRSQESHGSSYHRQLSFRSKVAKKLESASGLLGYWLIRDILSDHGFLTAGSKDERLRFTRLYLDSREVSASFIPKLSLDSSSFLMEMQQRYGLVILDGFRVPKGLEATVLQVPKFVRLIIDVPNKDEDLLHLLPVDRRRSYKDANANDVEVRFTRSIDFVSEFVNRYHGPAIHTSHGEEGHVLSPSHFKKSLVSRICGSELARVSRQADDIVR